MHKDIDMNALVVIPSLDDSLGFLVPEMSVEDVAASSLSSDCSTRRALRSFFFMSDLKDMSPAACGLLNERQPQIHLKQYI
jgi:hypothetical protein